MTLLVARHLATGAGQTFHLLGEILTLKAAADDTGGAYALFETRVPPRQAVPRRRQDLEDVAFFVLTGLYELWIADRTLLLEAGAFAFVPRRTAYGYRNAGSGTGRMLMLVSPGGIHERFLAEVGVPRADGSPPDMGKALAAAPKYGIEFLPSPG
jgi:quercetin dioxygenase-like cupin family protein